MSQSPVEGGTDFVHVVPEERSCDVYSDIVGLKRDQGKGGGGTSRNGKLAETGEKAKGENNVATATSRILYKEGSYFPKVNRRTSTITTGTTTMRRLQPAPTKKKPQKKTPASTAPPLTKANKGYQMLMKMGGWKEGKGIGKEEQGETKPLSVGMQTSRLGLGKAREVSEKKKEKRKIAASNSSSNNGGGGAQKKKKTLTDSQIHQMLRTDLSDADEALLYQLSRK
ncbi:hypothetical protein TrLO_g6935 [Triparma laevis f. longispina]|uniref:G-patch domain-containing protein n=1 Tax=Triparma laevis f. longispina TaxID=1714387 RepID=A0A9W7AK04_9STRA|nr:hypothetical protein TrLO_g6935 [Triparma laevis f. longispina]